MKDKNKTSITIENSIKNIGQKDWNACANQNSDDLIIHGQRHIKELEGLIIQNYKYLCPLLQ